MIISIYQYKIVLKHIAYNIIISKITFTGEFSSNADTPSQHISFSATMIIGFFTCTFCVELRLVVFGCIKTANCNICSADINSCSQPISLVGD